MAIQVVVTLVVLAAVSAAGARSAPASAKRQVIVLDALILQSGQAGPRGLKPSHVDSATGILHDTEHGSAVAALVFGAPTCLL